MGGPDNIRGIYYQVMISVERLLMLLCDYNVMHITLEEISDEEEDINIHYDDGSVLFEQVKTKRRGVWTFYEFFTKVFEKFLRNLKSQKNPDLINFSFISNAPPDKKLASLIYDIKPNITEANLYSQLNDCVKNKTILVSNRDLILKLIQKYDISSFIKTLMKFEPVFPYFSSDDPDQPEKYIRIYLEQKICLDCGKTINDAENTLIKLHNFALKKSRYQDPDKRKIRKKDVSEIAKPCISREEKWRNELGEYFPESLASLLYKEICLGNLFCPQFNIEISGEKKKWQLNLRIYSKRGTVFLFMRIGQSMSIHLEAKIKSLMRYIARKQNKTRVIFVTENLGSEYPQGITVVSSDNASIKRLKTILESE